MSADLVPFLGARSSNLRYVKFWRLYLLFYFFFYKFLITFKSKIIQLKSVRAPISVRVVVRLTLLYRRKLINTTSDYYMYIYSK